MAKEVVVYTGESCPYCNQAKALLKRRGVAFREVKLGWEDDAGWDALTEKSGMRTVPVIYAGETLIGGYRELAALDSDNELASLKG